MALAVVTNAATSENKIESINCNKKYYISVREKKNSVASSWIFPPLGSLYSHIIHTGFKFKTCLTPSLFEFAKQSSIELLKPYPACTFTFLEVPPYSILEFNKYRNMAIMSKYVYVV
jgi:hypothetical protein